jgi:hypothetical protein
MTITITITITIGVTIITTINITGGKHGNGGSAIG